MWCLLGLTLSGLGPPETRVPGPFAPTKKLVVSLSPPLRAQSVLSDDVYLQKKVQQASAA
eukprot:scaffold158787_cov21-Tisochrysis_lutea.AAC.1